MVTFTGTVERFKDEGLATLWYYHVVVPQDIAEPYIRPDSRRVVVAFPDGKTKHCALMPRGDGSWYIILNKQERTRLKVDVEDLLTLSIEIDDSEYGMPIPEELQVLWDQDEEGSEYFHKLTPGKQRTLINWVCTVKNPDIRIRRAIVMLNHLKALRGGIDFKKLNAEIKIANQR